jgi:RHS repeat-associated protein
VKSKKNISSTESAGDDEKSPLAAVSLPKGGGAIRGIGEKFAVNPVTGTGSLTVPIASSPGRAGFGPQLSLSYDSGAGNGPYGFGWSLGLPSITRKTDKGLPQYRDADESDVFILSGAEDLVPVLDNAGKRLHKQRTVHKVVYDIYVYRPRIEGLFARIERWVAADTGLSHWRSITRDNVTTLYGFDDRSRIADPSDPCKIFSYRISRTFDDKGNLTVFDYVTEDGIGVDRSQAHEASRTDSGRAAPQYLKSIRYPHIAPYFPDWSANGEEVPLPDDWHFELVLDYGDHSPDVPVPTRDRPWPVRPDPFSTYRAGFEVRTYRRCQRVLLFHHFSQDPQIGKDCLVRSTDFSYSDQQTPADPKNPVYTFLQSVTQTGYRRDGNGYLHKSVPPLEFEYSQPQIRPEVLTLDAESLANLPEGLDGSRYRWVDLDGEGLSGILTDAGGAWGYKRNLSPLNQTTLPDGSRAARARFGPLESVGSLPSRSDLGGRQQLLDLSGNGQLDVVALDDPVAGFYERTQEEDWEPFQQFASLPRIDWSEPNLKFVDLTGDGLADVLITEDGVFTFYPSLGESGFGAAEKVHTSWDEERGPRAVLADSAQTIFLADMSGDGLSDIVRVRNGEVCYWPNLGYGRFGAKVAMDRSPRFAAGETFDPRRIRLADIDGSGATDLLYIGYDGVHVCFNRAGNSWATPQRIAVFPTADSLSAVQVIDLLGNGTACLVWSSPLAGERSAPLRYVDLMGGQKPHLMIRSCNNLGAETRLRYAPSTRFYLTDKMAGRPWITKLPHLVYVAERVETYDLIGRSRFVTRYAYHHGYFDGYEREFRGFGMVEQWDTEEHRADTNFPEVEDANWSEDSCVPPVLTRTWFHTGAFVESDVVSRQYAHEYWVEPALRGSSPAAIAAREAMLLADTFIEDANGLDGEELREAYRALKGSTLRTEVFSQDRTLRAEHPYTVTEQNLFVRRLQSRGPNKHAVFLTQSRESLHYHYERQPNDPRVTHDLTLEVDEFGNARRSVSVAYGRRAGYPEPEPNLSGSFRTMLAHDQNRLHIGATEHVFTKSVNRPWDNSIFDVYRAPLPCEVITAEFTGVTPASARFNFGEMDDHWAPLWSGANDIPYEDVSTPDIEGVGIPVAFARRIVELSRILYRHDDLNALLPLGLIESHAFPGESYRMALTPSLLSRTFGTRVTDAILLEGGYIRPPGQSGWWVPSGRGYFSPGDGDTAVQELAEARNHFYLVRRAVNPLGAVSRVAYDDYDLLPKTVTDALGNVTLASNDYRVLNPFRSTDPNGNHTEVAFDVLGMVVGTVVSGKTGEGDSWAGFDTDLPTAAIAAARSDPLADPNAILGSASSRIVIDLFAYFRTRDQASPEPPMVYTLSRETHVSDLPAGQTTRYHHVFAYSDGFGREAQHKAQAEAGPVPNVGSNVSPRWVGSGWTIYNNKGKPVRKYEPFFATTHAPEFNEQVGVSSVLLYDSVERLVATLHPDNTYEKTAFDAWRQETWDLSDTTLIADPRNDPDVGGFFRQLLGSAPNAFTSWHDRRIAGTFGNSAQERAASQDAAQKAAAHAGTPTVAHLDSLGRTCLGVADNGMNAGMPQRYPTRTAMDTESKPLAVFDAVGRHVMEFCLREPLPGGASGFRYVAGYDIAGNPLYRNGMDGGERHMLHNVLGHPLRTWDARGFVFRVRYDALHRPTHHFLGRPGFGETLTERLVYGETHPDAFRNLRGRLFRHYDAAGVASNDHYDFKGNLLETGRQLGAAYRETPDWSAIAAITDSPSLDIPALDLATSPLLVAADGFAAYSRFDAFNRPVQMVTPHTAGSPPSVIQPAYNEANLLERIDVWLRQSAVPAALLNPASADVHAVTGIDYNARGQRIEVALANGAVTTYAYDPENFRLTALETTRPHADPDARTVQDLAYAYDPMGNITRLRDTADIHNVVYFQNQRVEPSSDYTYDPLYRLIAASGREHLGQNGGTLNPAQQVTNNDGARIRILHPGDGNAVGNYTERYTYDAVGNLVNMLHQVASGAWTRRYAYLEPSLITPAETSNRLSATSLPGDSPLGPYSAPYAYDEHGNMIRMPHLPGMTWDEQDHLQSTTRQVVNAGTPETTFYTYDAEGQRVRKVTERQAADGVSPTRKSERIYLGAIEIHREYDGLGNLALERETLHVLLDQRRVAVIESRTPRTVANDLAPARLIRYQHGNLLGSASLELDDQADVISYEEYFPYGASAYQAVRNQTDTPKRYRYTGKERDEENDLYYHGARYYAPWLGRWTACDPAGLDDGPNVYMYVHGNPVALSDPTGMWGWREVAVVAAVVVVGTVLTVATAGVAGPLVVGAVASIGLSGAAATVVTGVAVGAIAGAVGGAAAGAAGEATRQTVNSRALGLGTESFSGSRIASAAGRGAVEGAVIGGAVGGIAAFAATAAGGAAVAAAGRLGQRVVPSVIRQGGAALGRGIVGAGRAVARAPGLRQAGQVLARGAQGIGRGLQAIERGGQDLGISMARGLFQQGSRGAQAVARFAATRNIAATFSSARAPTSGPYADVGGHHIHQGASYGSGEAALTNPNYPAGITVEHGRGFTREMHRLADAVQRNLNRAYRGATVNQPIIGETVQIAASGQGTLAATANPFLEDVKAYYSLRAAGIEQEASLNLVNQSSRQLLSTGTVPVRVPTR